MKVVQLPKFDVDPDMLGEATGEELGLLCRHQVPCVTQERIEALSVLLDRGEEWELGQLCQPIHAHRRVETQVTEFLEAFPG